MSRTKQYIGLLILAYASVQPVSAGTTGYVEYGYMHNDNYNLAREPQDKISEAIHSLSATLVHLTPISYKSGLLATGGFNYAYYTRSEEMSGPTYYLHGGMYHRWSYRYSFIGLVGGYRKLHRNTSQDQDGWSTRANFIQKLSPVYWMNEQFFYEQGAARNLPDGYRGYGLSIWLHRALKGGSEIAAAITGAKKAHDDPLDWDITNYQFLIEWLCPIQKQFYVRTNAVFTVASNDGHYDHKSVIGSVTLGYQF